MSTKVFNSLLNFYKENKEDILDYKDFAASFPSEYVERIGETVILNSLFEKTKILIMTANAVEQNVLTHKLYNEVNANGENRKLHEMSINGFVYQFASIGEIEIIHMHPISVASFTVGGAEDALQDAFKRFKPELVVSLGVAFGIDCDKQALGDVLLSSGIIPYDVFQKNTNGKIKLRPKDCMETDKVLNAWDVLWRNEVFSLEQYSERMSLTNKELKFKWQYEMILSGGTVLSSEKDKKKLLKAAAKMGVDNVVGGEMEGVGVYKICKKYKIPCIVIKGICDWAEEKNAWEKVVDVVEGEQCSNEKEKITNDLVKDCVQGYAMDHAVEALLRFLRFDVVCLQQSLKESNAKQNLLKRFNTLNIDIKNSPQADSLCGWGLKVAKLSIVPVLMIIALGEKNQMIYDLRKMSMLFVICILWIGIIVYEIVRVRPINHKHVWVEIALLESYSKVPNMEIRLNDTKTIYNVIVSNWKRDKRTKLWAESSKDIIRGNTGIQCVDDIVLRKENVVQIDYQLSNGQNYVHLFTRKDKSSKVYVERIFYVKNQRYYFITKRNGMIIQTD